MAAPASNKSFGFLRSFPKGINSDIDPLLLPPDQLAFGLNTTVKGDFVEQRPIFTNLTLAGTTNDLNAFQTGLFQGACYYRSDDGYIMCAVNGNLFKIAISNQTATVSKIPFSIDLRSMNYPSNAAYPITIPITPYKVYTIKAGANEKSYSFDAVTYYTMASSTTYTIPATNASSKLYIKGTASSSVTAQITSSDANLSTATKNWLWQSERFLIWNDGVNLPAFYDSYLMRRSNGNSIASISSTAADFKIPAIGQVVNNGSSVTGVQITKDIPSNYWGKSFLVGTSQFVVLGTFLNNIAPFTTATMTTLQRGAATDTVVANSTLTTQFIPDSKYIGALTAAYTTNPSLLDYTYWDEIPHPVLPVNYVSVTLSISYTGTSRVRNPTPFYCSQTFNGNGGSTSDCYVEVGDVISVGGCSFSVTQATPDANNVINTIVGYPTNQAYNGLPITGQISFGQKTIIFQALKTGAGVNCTGANSTTCFSWCTFTGPSATAFTFGSYSSGSNITWNAGSGGVDNIFYVYLNQNAPYTFTGTFQATVGSSLISFTGTSIAGQNFIQNCQMVSPAQSATPSKLISKLTGSIVTSIDQLIVTPISGGAAVGQAVDTTTPTNPNYSVAVAAVNNSNVFNITNAPSVGQILTVTQPSGMVDVFVVTATSANGGSSANYVSLKNQTGVEGNLIPSGTSIVPLPEIPVSTIGVYGMGRNWVSLPSGKKFVGCDIVGGSSGSNIAPTNYNYEDSVLKVSQNQFLANGTTFSLPSSGDQIQGMQFTAQLDASLGQGTLQVFTDNAVFSCQAPTDAATWSQLTSPILVESLIGSGAISQTSIVQENGDIFFRSSDGEYRSLLMARLDFNKWGNTPISKEIKRIINNDDPALYPYCSSAVFNNRLLAACNPTQATRGVYNSSMAVLNFDPISSLSGKQPSVWDGQWTGLNILQLVTGYFAGVKRCFAICLSSSFSNIEIHEIQKDDVGINDNNSTPVNWYFESPMVFSYEHSHLCKRLIDGELYIDKIQSNLQIDVYYKSDQSDWTYWYTTYIDYSGPDNEFRSRIGLGSPSSSLMDVVNNKPMREGYDFQIKVSITGYCRFLGGRFAAEMIPQPEFAKPV
jgi:hypothetical protein